MAHISNFSKFKLMLENNNVNFISSKVINESEKLKDLPKIVPGNEVPSLAKLPALNNAYNIALEYIKANPNDPDIESFLSQVQAMLDEDKDILSVAFTGSQQWTKENYAALFYATEAGNNQNIGKKIGKNYMDTYKGRDLERVESYNVDLVPNTDSPLSTDVYTMGKVLAGTSLNIKDKEKQTYSLMSRVKQYMNAYNIVAYAANQNTYQGDNEELIEKGYVNFRADLAGSSLTLFVDTLTKRGEVSKDIETETKTVGYEPALKGQAELKYEQGSSVITKTEMPKVKALADVILDKFEGKTVDKFELTSSASPEWSGKETMANYAGKKTNGVGDPGAGTDFATKNFKLAYDRGVSLMNALNVMLKKAGHTGFPNYVVKWQVSDKGGPSNNGRFVDLEIDSNENKGKEVTTTTAVGTVEKEAGKETGKFVLYGYEMN
jgi:hypothetical protein